ncbi:hypothetical protein B0H10DRAFT_1942450 [Mycena sp. CBHHK59/15]|nr:hypothetical protein B0H10DRAFT_1942450 [Mycena sp. CBHHK59/15]
MSSSPAPSRSSVDCATAQLRPDVKQAPRPHPPRLQHSPSMPNIWSVVQYQVVDPCNTDQDPSSQTSSLNSAPEGPSLTSKHNRRRRINYDQPTVLLTPPLTPSSSIRTAGSIDSGTSSYSTGVDSAAVNLQSSTCEEEVGFTDPDTLSTRFLLLRNVSRKVTSDVLQFAILRSLAAANLSVPQAVTGGFSGSTGAHKTGPPTAHPNAHLPIIDTIKGVLLRYHESHGIAILAFYDVRQAKSAQALLSTPRTGALADCIGEEPEFGGQQGWLDCAFVTAQDLADMVGKSPFLTETEGTFFFAVEAVTTDPAGLDNTKREIDIATLTNLLKAYGGLRSFTFTSSRKVFHVEYYDVRDAKAAYSALDGQVMFGMHLVLLGGDSQSLESHVPASKKTDSESCIPFPSSHGEKPSVQTVVRFEPAGQQSHIRERFLFIDTAGKARPRSVSAGHESLEGSLPGSSNPPISSDSPPYFYTSPPTSPSSGTTPTSRTPESHSRRASNHLFFDAVGRAVNDVSDQPQHSPKRPRSISFNTVDGVERGHESEEDSTLVSPGAHDYDPRPPQIEYFYPPLDRFPLPSHPLSYYGGCPTPPLPSAFSYPYHPPPHPQLLGPGMGYPGCPPSPLGLPYEYDQQAHTHAVMNMNMGNWAFEQAMMVPAMGVFPGVPFPGPNVPAGSEYWQGSQTPSPQHTSYFHYPPHPPDSPPLQLSPITKMQSPTHPPFPYPNRLPSPPSPAPPPRTSLPATGPPSPANAREPPERNQLNLARIEDGQDTRTTVMIKNIPNKMSDKDLMAYIGSVCARKIDFLYLRMDFQNGCNVGYAFVNFINVQDLLRFAKAKLGEKWNMFSSEKVLQMSYANYQGKEALVEKFKNSCIMDEREAWQPKIFYSDSGPEQGLPEPFPAPTHLRRKERGSYNRGPLYVPGMMGGLQSASCQNRDRRPTDEHRLPPASRHCNDKPRRFRDTDEPNVYSLADGMAAASLSAKRAGKK